MNNPDISIILTFHDEGIVIHKTFLALDRMLKKLDENKVSYEIIAHIDNGDEKTINYIKSIEKSKKLKVFYNSFGEPAQSRNFSILQATGKYACLMDGDDLFSENWLIDAYNIQESSDEDIILHTEYNITFGLNEQPRLWRMKDSFDLDTDTLILLGRNRWSAGIFLKTETAKRFPYQQAVDCYGFEDWQYNCETRSSGIKHNIVPGSILFYRVRANSTYSRHTSDNTTISYTDAFSLEKMKSLYKPEFEKSAPVIPDNNKMLTVLRYGHKILRHTPVLKKADTKITKTIEGYRAKKKYAALSDALVTEWKNMNQIDGSLYPDPEIVSRMPVYDSELDYLGKAYCRMVHTITSNPDYIFMMPRLGVGGTEKVLENYLKAIYELHPKWRVLVLGKLPDGHPYHIPENVDFVDFDGATEGLNDWDKEFLITKLIVQTKAKRLHIVNNEFYYRWAINNHALILTNKIIVNLSFFMHEFAEDEKRIQSFADPYLVELEPCIHKIFTDNGTIVDDLVEREGIEKARFTTHYQPVNLEIRKPKTKASNGIHKILWASRVAPQKRPDILKKIANKLPEGYEIDVYGRIQKPYYKNNYFNGTKNLNYKGAFSDISALPIEEYDAYLYTSQTDGIPNILLEISALGLPIIATREGGVPDFIEDRVSGRLVEMNDIDGYIDALKETINSADRTKYVEKAQQKITERHNWDTYIKTVKKDI